MADSETTVDGESYIETILYIESILMAVTLCGRPNMHRNSTKFKEFRMFSLLVLFSLAFQKFF